MLEILLRVAKFLFPVIIDNSEIRREES